MITEEVRGWFTGRLPVALFQELVEVTVDREEITVVGRIEAPELAEGVSDTERRAAVEGRVAEFRERTREDRMEVAREAEAKFGRKVSWGVECGGTRGLYSNVSAPVMTRLRQPERQVLDLLVEGGVARSRSDALLWCVRLVQRHTGDWLDELKESLVNVQRVRGRGPNAGIGEQE
ncbi:hypothetical protein [Pseudofrankia asymbiotica]|uniref:Uncharacterized protein n=1 Tax=Pseudofrankia asymbiotica TaxID=1834516 RepID=A0A1V2I899_9ACTN|nr:hypothetical protein [Pseudofrankia asymbiotica]ONH24411.1 hypothetical protein BL253_30115 [Pseudofrankia asymbiotica]ONH28442.1 hypothetical protein BL253_19890 [Pseudofrankia asymbiotica]